MNSHVIDILFISLFEMRIDDNIVAKIMSRVSNKQLNQAWSIEFDIKNMIHATKMPLEYATKKWMKEDDIDVNDNVMRSSEKKWYYFWWNEIHLLCDNKRLKIEIYKIRLFFEILKDDLRFKKNFRCIKQFDFDLNDF